MLDLAIEIDADKRGIAVVETNHGDRKKAPDWPRDCEFQIVAFSPSGNNCEVVEADGLAEDIANALKALDEANAFSRRRPDWFRRLQRYARGASTAHAPRRL